MSMIGARPGMSATPPFRGLQANNKLFFTIEQHGKTGPVLHMESHQVPAAHQCPPLSQAPPGHSSFTPSKQSSSKTPTTLPKAPKAPEKPLMPYMRYSRKVWESVKAKNADLRLWQIGKIIGHMWRELSDAEKKEYMDAYEADKENLKIFHNSAQYQNYLREKQRAEHQIEEEERRSKNSAANEHRVSIQPADYNMETESNVSVKAVAASRYHRNHALVNELFSESLVPDSRSVVTEQRMALLRKQVRSLMDHQQKLEKELSDITDKFNAKKRKFTESSEEFAEKLKEECDSKPLMTSAKFEALVIKHKAELRSKYDKLFEQQKKQKQERMMAEQTSQQPASQQQPVYPGDQQMLAQQVPPQEMHPQQVALQPMAPQQMSSQQMSSPQMAPQQMAPQQMAPQQMAPQQMAPQQMAPQQMAPQQMSSQQMAPQQMAPQQMAPQQIAPQQMAPQQMAPQQMAPQQMASQQMAPQQMAPQQMAPQQMASQQMAPQQMAPQQMAPQQMAPQQMAPQQIAPQQVPSPMYQVSQSSAYSMGNPQFQSDAYSANQPAAYQQYSARESAVPDQQAVEPQTPAYPPPSAPTGATAGAPSDSTPGASEGIHPSSDTVNQTENIAKDEQNEGGPVTNSAGEDPPNENADHQT
ncbi:hypothetical protein EB796_014597 [Bugula neritina]|uniref:HMG box domain-containing protein n=1 Tax=Bugula neritina TaxID=10212 RepID=A0A7J7JL63_BUGNE|nr:hypothetical protein EB796_014597 [Bugula neritina]